MSLRKLRGVERRYRHRNNRIGPLRGGQREQCGSVSNRCRRATYGSASRLRMSPTAVSSTCDPGRESNSRSVCNHIRMLSYNGSIPGPTLKVREGSEITVKIENQGGT